MALVVTPRTKETSTTTGTGTLTLAGTVSGFQSFANVGNGNTTKFTILDANGTAWEESSGIYTTSGTTLTRVLSKSSTGSLISLSAGTHTVFCGWLSEDGQSVLNAQQTYIAGLLVTKTSAANTIDISAGACYDPSSNKVISYAGATGIAVGTLGASQWNQAYLYDVSGTATVQVVNNADPPSTTYAGTARQGGTNSNRRWLGAFLTDGSSNIRPGLVAGLAGGGVRVIHTEATGAAPYRVLSAGTATSYGAETTLAGIVPRYATPEIFALALLNLSTTAADNCTLTLSVDGTNDNGGRASLYISSTGVFAQVALPFNIDSALPGIYYKVGTGGGSGPNAYLDVYGYRFLR